MNEPLNNREIVVLFWLAVFIIYALTKHDVRSSLKSLLRQFIHPKIFIPLFLSILPAIGLIALLSRLGIWSHSLFKESFIWFIGTGFVMFMNSTSTKNGKELFKNTFKKSLQLIVILEFIINFYVFHIVVEFFLIPLLTLIVLTSTYANLQKDKQYKEAKKFLNWLVGLAGLVLIALALYNLAESPEKLFTLENSKKFVLPILLTFAYIPSVYLMGLFGAYESLFVRIGFFLKNKKHTYRIKLACLLRCKLSLGKVNRLTPILVRELTTSTSVIKASKIIKNTDLH